MSFEPKPAAFSTAYIPKPLSVQQVAEFLDVEVGTVYREIAKKRLIARKVGKFYRIHPARLDEYLRCPDPENLPDSINAPTPVSGSSEGPGLTDEPDFAEMAKERRQKRRSRAT